MRNERKAFGRLTGVHYSVLQGLYWMLQCGYYAFGASYLFQLGLSSTLTGVVLALVGAVSALTQAQIANAADRRNALAPKWIAVILMAPVCVLLLLLSFGIRPLWLSIALYAVVWVLVMDVQFLLCAMSMDSVKAGARVNFGVSRAFGSMSYALSAYALGLICAARGTAITVPIAAGLSVLFLLALLLWRVPAYKEDAQATGALEEEADTRFFGRYPRFLLFVLGCALCMIAYSTTCNYMVRIVNVLGGGSKELGTVTMITALCEIPTLLASMRLNKRFGSNRLMMVSAVMLSVKMLLVTFASSIPFLYASMLTQLFSYSLFIPVSVYYVDALMQKRDRMKGQATMTLLFAIGNAVGSVFGGFLLDTVQEHGMLLCCLAISCIGTVVMVCGTQRGDMRPKAAQSTESA
ncbi:MAG: MFS transporter [Clostridia bacterium]|nr:MFS transporter [Clostridia bacterium]